MTINHNRMFELITNQVELMRDLNSHEKEKLIALAENIYRMESTIDRSKSKLEQDIIAAISRAADSINQ